MISRLLDLARLRSATLNRYPFEWAYIEESFKSPQGGVELLETFPRKDFWHIRGGDGEKFSDYAARPLVTLGATHPAALAPLAPAWRKLVADLLSREYREALSELTGRDLADALMEASIWRWDRDAQLGPHKDLPDKILTHVIYLASEWDVSRGGCLRILNSADENAVAAELVPRLGTASVLVRSDRSWHSVTPVTAKATEPRRNVIVTWFLPGSRSPVWAVDHQGRITCTAGGIREDASALGRFSQRARWIARRVGGRVSRK